MDGLRKDNMSEIEKMYKDSMSAVEICLESLKDIADTSPTNGVIRSRALDTIKEVNNILNLNKE